MSSIDISRISGNASEKIKRYLSHPPSFFDIYAKGQLKHSFGHTIMERMDVQEISILNMAEEPSRKEGRVVCKVIVDEDMLNGDANLHGGCSCFLVDM